MTNARLPPGRPPPPRNGTRWGRACPVPLLPATAALALAGCSSLNVEPFPEPLNSTPPELEDEVLLAAPDDDPEPAAPTVTRAPGVTGGPAFAEGTPDDLGQDLTGEAISVAFHDAPLPNFIDELFNQRLGLSFLIAPNLRDDTSLVTLRIAEPMVPAELFALARRILEEHYGVRVRADADGLLTFEATDEITASGIPLLISGRAGPEVPATHRTVFQVVHLKVVSPRRIAGLLQELLSGVELDVDERPTLGAVMLKGNLTTIDRAVAIIDVLDQPLLSGRHGIVIEPAFLDAAQLAQDLSTVLRSQGYSTSVGYSDLAGAIVLLPLKSANKLVVFAADPGILPQVEQWAAVADAEREAAVEDGWFYYRFRNTLAEDLTETLNAILSIESAAETETELDDRSRPRRRSNEPLVFDKSRNAVLYRGNGQEWSRIRTLIERLDKPVPQVLIEVLLAEVTLSGKEESGIEYLASFGINGRGVDAQLTAGGLSFTLDGAGATRALLRLAYEDNRVALRSLPRLIVKSGESGSIFAGTQVPILSQRAEGVQVAGSTSIVQQIQYRDTGVTLNITPIVQANGLVDLTIGQQFSETRAAGAASLTPTILTRDLQTSMTLRDGQSVLMGGLISESQSQGRSGVPGLARLPVIGHLFRANSFQNDRTELVVMVIPYVIADHRQGRELTEQIESQLELHRRFL